MKHLFFFLLVLFPVSAFAHGQEVLVSFFYDLLTFIALTVFILCIKWEANGKALLALVLIFSAAIPFVVTGQWPYRTNRILIDLLCVGVPIVSVLSAYLIFRKKFAVKMKSNNTSNIGNL